MFLPSKTGRGNRKRKRKRKGRSEGADQLVHYLRVVFVFEGMDSFGQFLRRTRLDELPQLWNILRGDMSLVGPRPERAYFYREFVTYIPGFSNRMMVTPGLTGWAQVNGGYDLRPEEKIVYDMEYIERQSVLLDVQCLLKTAALVFTHRGAR